MLEKLYQKIINTNSAFIFTGIEGVGKTRSAINLAKASICKNFPPCNTCNDCLRIDKNIHPNLILIEPDGKEIKIEQIRDTIKNFAFTPLENKKRFIIINKAHRLNNSSANALLKSLEQPPKNTIFILCTSNLNLLLATIRSRCEIIKFPPLSKNNIAKILNIKSDHKLLDYSLGSIKKTKFYLQYEDNFLALLDLLESKNISYNDITRLTNLLYEKVGTDLSSAEHIFSFIINFLNNRIKTNIDDERDFNNILDAVVKINNISKKIYSNTPVNLVTEAILIEAGRVIN